MIYCPSSPRWKRIFLQGSRLTDQNGYIKICTKQNGYIKICTKQMVLVGSPEMSLKSVLLQSGDKKRSVPIEPSTKMTEEQK